MSYQWQFDEQSEKPPSRSERTLPRRVFGPILLLLVLVVTATGFAAGHLLRQRFDNGQPGPAVALQPEPTLPAATSTPQAESTLPPALVTSGLLNRIVYIGANGQVNTMRPDGSDNRQLTQGNHRYHFPVWSPDGSYIAAIGGSRTTAGIYLFDDAPSEENEERIIYEDGNRAPIYMYWSPDSSQISFIANQPGSLGLFLSPVNGDESRLVASGQPFYWDWAPDGSRLLIHAGAGGDDQRTTFLTPEGVEDEGQLGMPGLFQAPGMAPSGNYWAVSEERENGNLWLVVQNNLAAAEVSYRHAGFISMGWSPVADQLAYISPQQNVNSTAGPLRMVTLDNGENDLLSLERVRAFFWSPDGSKIAFLVDSVGPRINASLSNLRRGRGRVLNQFQPGREMELWVVDIATGNSRLLTTFTPTPIFLLQFLPFFDQYALSHRLWSPDSTALVIPTLQDETPHLMVVPVNGGSPEVLRVGDMAFWSHQ